jgi:hypothetical protein
MLYYHNMIFISISTENITILISDKLMKHSQIKNFEYYAMDFLDFHIIIELLE